MKTKTCEYNPIFCEKIDYNSFSKLRTLHFKNHANSKLNPWEVGKITRNNVGPERRNYKKKNLHLYHTIM
jgi:hypothetical protein